MPTGVPEVPAEVMGVFGAFPPAQRNALITTWRTATGLLPAAEQCIAWKMPSLRIDGDLVLSLLGFNDHNSVFPGPGVIETLGPVLAGLTTTKGTIHFDRDAPMKRSILKAIVEARIDEINNSYPRGNGRFKEFYANGFLKAAGSVKSGDMHGKWEWFRRDGTLKRSGQFAAGQQVGTWTTYDAQGQPYKTTDFDRG